MSWSSMLLFTALFTIKQTGSGQASLILGYPALLPGCLLPGCRLPAVLSGSARLAHHLLQDSPGGLSASDYCGRSHSVEAASRAAATPHTCSCHQPGTLPHTPSPNYHTSQHPSTQLSHLTTPHHPTITPNQHPITQLSHLTRPHHPTITPH